MLLKNQSSPVKQMRRRTFLVKSGCAALGSYLIPLTLQSEESKKNSLVIALETLIPKLMQESTVPGVSIAVVEDGRVLWRRAFGLKDNATKEVVDDETLFEA